MIDSADFSAQTRKRYYWTNIPILPYEKKNILIKDILFNAMRREDISDKVNEYLSDKYNGRKIQKNVKYSIKTIYDKSRTIATNSNQIGANAELILKIDDKYYKPNIWEFERLQTLPDFYLYSDLTTNERVKLIGNAWTVDVIAHIFKGLLV